MVISFEKKVALVTCAASGLGLATAKAFAEAGAAVVLADWNEKETRVAAKQLADKGHKTLAVTCRGVFDLEARRKPQAFAADAVSLMEFQSQPADT